MLDPAIVEGMRPERWPDAHHPKLARPYFAEYGERIRRPRPWRRRAAGVRGFPLELDGLGLLRLTESDRGGPLRRYLAGLDRHARRKGRRAAFCLTRSTLALRWFGRRCRGTHLLLLRSPLQQWISFLEQQRAGNPYFLAVLLWTYFRNAERSPFDRLRGRLALPRFEGVAPAERYEAACAELEAWSLRSLFLLHLLVWLTAVLEGIGQVDLVVSLELASADPSYREELAAELGACLGREPLSLDDCRIAVREAAAAGLAPRELEAVRREALALARRAWPPERGWPWRSAPWDLFDFGSEGPQRTRASLGRAAAKARSSVSPRPRR